MFNPTRILGERQGPAPPSGPPRRLTQADVPPSLLPAALDYCRRGFCPIPQRPGEKWPYVRWTPFQDVQPSRDHLESWFLRQFPDAGIALVLGPAFGLFVIDVDGEDAYSTLVARLGSVPKAPTVLSGSAKPFKEHYYFKHPDVTPIPPPGPDVTARIAAYDQRYEGQHEDEPRSWLRTRR